MPPKKDTAHSVKLDVKIGREEAYKWHSFSEAMVTAHYQAESLVLSEQYFSFAGGEIYKAYQDAQQWIAGLVKGAAENLDNMGRALLETADRFGAQDAESSAKIEGSYRSRDSYN